MSRNNAKSGSRRQTKKSVSISEDVVCHEEHVVHWLEQHHSYEREHFENIAAARLRCQVQRQWHLSIENYSKVRKRQSNVPSTRDAEAPLPNSANSDGMRSSVNGSVSSLSENSIEHGSTVHLGKEDELTIDFGSKPGLWRKTMRSVILRLRGQEQHKDVYVMPAHLRSQLKQMYVY